MIRIEKACKAYDAGSVVAVDRLSLEVQAGELLVLLGTSGCGKTTSLKMINRLIEPTSGAIYVDGQDNRSVSGVQLRRHIGYVFQGVGLFPHMTIGENVGLVPALLRWRRSDIDARVDELLQLVNLAPPEFRDRYPRELSGGQRQRVGVARALAGKPRIMLMDEPFGALDPLTRDDLQGEYGRIHRQLELTTVMVTHDMTESLLMADRIAVMQAGRLLQVGTPRELLTAPADAYVGALMKTPKRQADQLEALMTKT
jgi:osmoprotectant transport system ATP-binding protein